MGIKTSVNSSNPSISSSRAFNDLIFAPGDDVESRIVTIDDKPIHIFGALPRDRVLHVFRVYNGPSRECNDIPDLPVPCASEVLTNDGVTIVTDQWMSHRGSYRFVYTSTDGAVVTEIPSDVYVWFMYDDSIEGCCNGC